MPRPGRLALASVLVLATTTGPGALAAGPGARRIGSAARVPAGARVVGPLGGSTRMQVSVALEPRDPAALEALATAVSTPGSSLYGQYITPSQFAERFGPTSAEIDAVEASLRAHGVTPGSPSANHLSIPVSATASQLERAFSLTLERIALRSRKSAIINTAAPELDANIAGLVQGVVGLSSLSAPHPLFARPHVTGVRPHASAHVATGGPQPCQEARAAAPGQAAYTADQIASAYGFPGFYSAGNKGKGQTVGLYELEPYSASDIVAYQSCYGTQAQVSNVDVDGGATGAQVGEAALDIEQSIGLVPEANLIVYSAPNSNSSAPGSGYYDNWSTIVTQDRARVISASWGQCEPLVSGSDAAAEATLFQEAAAQGQSIISAAGDEGSEDCNSQTLIDPSLAVDDPSSQPFVTGVGGTTMPVLGPRPTERVWNDGGGLSGLLGLAPGAGGGGRSQRWPMPAYQSGAPSSLHVNQSSSRESPDISADADPNTGYLIFWNGSGASQGPSGWQGVGGTSAAAPVWAAAVALMNASRACGGGHIGFLNPALYKTAASAYSQDFNDITQGNNDFTGTNGGRYAAGSAFDMASGLGTPNASALTAIMCKFAARAGHPRIAGASLSGVRHAHPTLRLKIAAGKSAPALRRLSVELPGALRFTHRLRGISLGRLRFSASLKRGILTITLTHTASQVTITIASPTLKVTHHEVVVVRHGHAKRLRIVVTVTDAHGTRTQLAAAVRPR